ncbi:MAG: MaoC family dehydratase [Deltaproteobacteria bacterium]|nr:MaoC family dehydratase [Deltaproteobacteria bacterium]MBT4638516.1 MaoC family dehydratase [Deltaproteobacteria bacterium]MBT6501595.1 MaoC family dehydratase [Deltaproteobacteria bacterium]MBT6610499.1 MaoC family dehydratase [Deltaproteobacteria bacterium]MBT7712100.1 MaoC family dehydratase [Deltaproteobacteria bacterium]
MEILPLEEIKARIGQEIGKSEWIQIDQDRINQFAECTGDHQWIHVDEEKAAAGPFGTTIGHGFLTISMLPKMSEDTSLIPEGTMMAINYGLNKVRLLNPVTVGSKIRDTIVLGSVTEKSGGRILISTTNTIEIEGQEKPACVAEMLSMFFTQ